MSCQINPEDVELAEFSDPSECDDYFSKLQFEKLQKIFEGGNPYALYDAINFAKQRKLPFPEWVNKGLKEVFEFVFHEKKVTSIGRGARWQEQHKTDYKHYARWFIVDFLKQALPDLPLGNIFPIVADICKKIPQIKAGEEMIKKSYNFVNNEIKEGCSRSELPQYYFSPVFLEAFGIVGQSDEIMRLIQEKIETTSSLKK
ncbi:MAG: hypothetical protein HQM08_28115 [Candidatus Riflebacteria bacterium]|nr:hypothetical protein [Candidatus Riflebacteria bacterium]